MRIIFISLSVIAQFAIWTEPVCDLLSSGLISCLPLEVLATIRLHSRVVVLGGVRLKSGTLITFIANGLPAPLVAGSCLTMLVHYGHFAPKIIFQRDIAQNVPYHRLNQAIPSLLCCNCAVVCIELWRVAYNSFLSVLYLRNDNS